MVLYVMTIISCGCIWLYVMTVIFMWLYMVIYPDCYFYVDVYGYMVRGGGGARGQFLEHLQKVVFLCWSFLEVYIFATTYQKAFIVGPKVTYPTL